MIHKITCEYNQCFMVPVTTLESDPRRERIQATIDFHHPLCSDEVGFYSMLIADEWGNILDSHRDGTWEDAWRSVNASLRGLGII